MIAPEDLDKLKSLLAMKNGEPIPTHIDIPQLSPSAAADPYSTAAAGYNARADALEQQAMQPRQPDTGLAAALRNAIENMGAWGAPGGHYGQEELRSQEAERQNDKRLGIAAQLRNLAEKQQGLGINASNEARQENYNQGQLEETRQLRERQALQEQELNRHNSAMEEIERNKPVSMAPGTQLATPQGKVLATNAPKPVNLRHVVLDNKGKPEIWSIDANSRPIEKVGDAPAGTAGASNLALSQSTDTNGNAVLTIVDKKNATSKPVMNNGTPTLTADEGKANAKADAKSAADYETAANSLAAMEGLKKRGTYASDQAMADAFFNIIKPGSGARMNQAQIDRFVTPGPLRDKMVAWAQKLDQGQPLDGPAREDLYQSAKVVVDSKKPKPRNGAPAASESSVPVVGSTFNGAKVLKVTPIK